MLGVKSFNAVKHFCLYQSTACIGRQGGHTSKNHPNWRRTNKIDAFAASEMHNKTHSIQLVMITTMGVARGEHASIVNQSVVLDNLFSDRRTQIL